MLEIGSSLAQPDSGTMHASLCFGKDLALAGKGRLLGDPSSRLQVNSIGHLVDAGIFCSGSGSR